MVIDHTRVSTNQGNVILNNFNTYLRVMMHNSRTIEIVLMICIARMMIEFVDNDICLLYSCRESIVGFNTIRRTVLVLLLQICRQNLWKHPIYVVFCYNPLDLRLALDK